MKRKLQSVAGVSEQRKIAERDLRYFGPVKNNGGAEGDRKINSYYCFRKQQVAILPVSIECMHAIGFISDPSNATKMNWQVIFALISPPEK